MRRRALMLIATTLAACHPRRDTVSTVVTTDDAGFLVPPPPRPPPPTACVQTSFAWFLAPSVHDAGDGVDMGVEGVSLARAAVDAPWWAAWSDGRTGSMTVARSRMVSRSTPVGADVFDGPVFTMAAATPVVVWLRQRAGARSHVVAMGDDLAVRCEQPEDLDDSMSIAATSVRGGEGVLVAWDEDRPVERAIAGTVAGAVISQVVATHAEGHACPAVRVLSPQGQDAGDPIVVSLADGGAVVLWLATVSVASTDGHDTSTSIWGVVLDGLGVPRGHPVPLATDTARRFGLAATLAGETLWITYRVAADSDNEGRGDGGDVLAFSINANLTRAGTSIVVTPDEANPTGSPKVVADARGAEVWWLDRRQNDTVTVRRTLDPQGHLASVAQDEPRAAGELPVARDRDEVVTALRTGGGAGIARLRCPWMPAVPGGAPGNH